MTVPELRTEVKNRNDDKRKPNLSCKGNRSELLLTLANDDRRLYFLNDLERYKTDNNLVVVNTEEWERLTEEWKNERRKMTNLMLVNNNELKTLEKERTQLKDDLVRVRRQTHVYSRHIAEITSDLEKKNREVDHLKSIKAKLEIDLQRTRSLIESKATDDRREIEAANTLVASAKSRESIALELSSLTNKAYEKASSDLAIIQKEIKEAKVEIETIQTRVLETAVNPTQYRDHSEACMKLQIANQRLRALEERSKLALSWLDLTKETESVADRDLFTAKQGLSDALDFQKEVEGRLEVIDIAESDDEVEEENPTPPNTDTSAMDEDETPAPNTNVSSGSESITESRATSASVVLNTAETESTTQSTENEPDAPGADDERTPAPAVLDTPLESEETAAVNRSGNEAPAIDNG